MRDSEALQRAILSMLDVVEELAARVGEPEWSAVVSGVFADHRRELRLAIPSRLIDACGGNEEAAAGVLRVLERASRFQERPSEAAMREAFGPTAFPPARARVRIAVEDRGDDAA